MSLYTIEALTKTYGARTILDIPDLTVEQGSVCALLGANGAGKTTLLNLLAFLDTPTAGTIHFRSSPVRHVEKELLRLRRQVIMVDQHPILFTNTVFKNLEFGLKIRGIAGPERRNRIEEALDLVGMQKFMHTPATSLSGGESQRVALARVLVLKPQVLLCDEPTSNVDTANQAIIIDLLKRLNSAQQMSIIFATHDRSLAATLAHRTIHLDHGRRTDSRGENIFPAVLQPDAGGRLICSLPGGLNLVMTGSNRNIPAETRAQVCMNPWGIALVPDESNVPDCNVIRGKIVKIEMENSHIHVVAEAGPRFSLFMDEQAYEKCKLRVGKEMLFHVPPDEITPRTV